MKHGSKMNMAVLRRLLTGYLKKWLFLLLWQVLS